MIGYLLDSLLPMIDPWAQTVLPPSDVVLEMLAAVLGSDSQKLEQLVRANPSHINHPIGLPFDAHGGRFFNHPSMQHCVISQHSAQTLLDIACALPTGPVVWVLLAYGAKGSSHPLGTDLALHNAIKNGRLHTVQTLLQGGHSDVNGSPANLWRPLLQATFWNFPEIVRCLLDRGVRVNDISSGSRGTPFQTALQMVLKRRAKDFLNQPVRERCEQILKMLLDAGATIDVPPAVGSDGLTPFETFIKPWQGNALWAVSLGPRDIECLELFVRKGADLQVLFTGFPCSAPSGTSFEHQVLWHSTPLIARLLIDNASPGTGANGSNLLHEIIGCCPDAKRHPADTLRDIDVILKQGANLNCVDRYGYTPLTKCIEQCPGVDVVARLTALLEGGANPELKDGNMVRPFILAARAFEEPLRSQVMTMLVPRFQARYFEFNGTASTHFPIPICPTFTQVLWYTGQDGGFESSICSELPEDVIPVFRKAAFNVASKRFLDAITERAKTDTHLDSDHKDELLRIITMRESRGLPGYDFDQDFVMSILVPTSRNQSATMNGSVYNTSNLSQGDFHAVSTLSEETPAPMPLLLAPDLQAPLSDTLQIVPSNRRASTSSTSSNGSSSSFWVPTTTQIRWPVTGDAVNPANLKKASSRVLNYACESCNDGKKLTAVEFNRHEDEHYHTLTCDVVDCKRRFCMAERD
jgi:ankyrin repeat protein